MPQRDLLLPWYAATDNAALALLNRGTRRTEARRGRASSSSASAWAASSSRRRPSSPAACASGSPSCARCSRASRCCSSTSPSPRSTRSPAPRCRSGWPARCAPTRAPSSSSRHDVEEALYLCDRVAVLSARPARLVAELAAPAPRAPTATTPSPTPASPRSREQALRGASARVRVRRWCSRALLLAAPLRRLADRRRAPGRSPTCSASRTSSSPRPPRSRRALGGPLAARRQRLGDAEGGAARLPLRPRRRPRLRGRAAPLPRPCAGPSIR